MYKEVSSHLLNARKAMMLYDQAEVLIGMGEYRAALELAQNLKGLGFDNFCSSVWIDVAKEDNRPELMERARELIVPVARRLCERGFHLSEAMHYRKAGMENECRAAYAEYLVALKSGDINQRGYALADRMIWGKGKGTFS